MKQMKRILSILLAVVLLFSLSLTVSAAGNVVYTNGTDATTWPYKSAYINTITLEGATVKKYEWSGDTCNVVLTSDTASDAAITFNVTKAGTNMWVKKMTMTLNGTSFSDKATVQLADGKLDKAALYVDATFKSGTKYFSFSIAEPNNLPVLTDSSKNSETAEVTAGEAYSINLPALFTDADAADTLSYNVSINGADAVTAPVDADGNYSYTQLVAGEYKLVFTATDSKGDTSTDTYTTNLTVKNSDVTYDMTVKMPNGMVPTVYANAGFDSNGAALNGVSLTVTAGAGSSYTVAVPVNVSMINIVNDDYKQAVAASSGSVVSMRSVLVSGADMFDTAVAVTATVKDADSHAVSGSGTTFLMKCGETYSVTTTPSDTNSYATATSSFTLEAGDTQAQINALVNYNNQRTITTPTGAEARLFRYNKYYDNAEYVCRGTKDNGNGTSTHYFSGVVKSTYDPTLALIYRVEREGSITKAGWMGSNAVTVTYSNSEIGPKDRVDYTASTEANAAFAEDSVLLNINKQNNLSMEVGSSKTLKAYRAWEIIPVSYNNWIIEPDFHFNVLWESEDGVISLSDKANNMTGGESWKTLTANKEGTAIIEVTYDAIDIRGGQYNGVYGASDPARTGLVVVQVGGNDSSVDFGIDSMASQGSVVYEKSSPKVWDAEFDTLYFTGESGELKLTPTASGSIQSVAVSNNKGSSWTELSAVEGVYSATITSGNNLIRVTTDGGVAYQVVRGDKVTISIEELSDNENNDGDGIFESGEVVRVTIDGLHSPIPKMAGNYNPGYGGNTDGYSSHHLSYLQGGSRVQGAGAQYNWIRNTNYIDVTLPESGNLCTLEDGCIGVGIIGLTQFANGGDSHRNIPDSGCSTRGSETTFNTRSMLPDIEINVVETAKYDVTLSEGEGYSLTPVEDSESPVAEGGNYSFTLSVEVGYKAGESFAVKANDVKLTAVDGVYTIENINEAQIITVEGIVKEVAHGDPNGDGEINSTDAALLLRIISGMETAAVDASVMDVSGDGKVNATDASLILRYAAGLITEFPNANNA